MPDTPVCLLVCSHCPDLSFMLETSPLTYPTLQFPAPLPNQTQRARGAPAGCTAELELLGRDKGRSCSSRKLLGPLYCYFLAFLIHVLHDTSIFSTFVLSGIELCRQSRLSQVFCRHKAMCSCCGCILLLNTFSPQATTQIYCQRDGAFKN